MTVPGPGSEPDPDPFAPPRPGAPTSPSPYLSGRQRSRRTEVLLKVLVAVAVVTVLGFAALAALFVWAMASYGDNK